MSLAEITHLGEVTVHFLHHSTNSLFLDSVHCQNRKVSRGVTEPWIAWRQWLFGCSAAGTVICLCKSCLFDCENVSFAQCEACSRGCAWHRCCSCWQADTRATVKPIPIALGCFSANVSQLSRQFKNKVHILSTRRLWKTTSATMGLSADTHSLWSCNWKSILWYRVAAQLWNH